MILQSLKHAEWPALLACAAMAACSKTAASGDAYVNASVGGGVLCAGLGPSQSFVSIGTTNANMPSTVPDGTGPVSIDCTVSQSGNGYDLRLGATGPQGGKFTVSGHVDATTGGTVRAQFVNQVVGASFAADACTLTYTYAGIKVPTNPAISAGQIFAHIDCPNAQNQGTTQVTTPDGGTSSEICAANADFLFQNCAQ